MTVRPGVVINHNMIYSLNGSATGVSIISVIKDLQKQNLLQRELLITRVGPGR